MRFAGTQKPGAERDGARWCCLLHLEQAVMLPAPSVGHHMGGCWQATDAAQTDSTEAAGGGAGMRLGFLPGLYTNSGD